MFKVLIISIIALILLILASSLLAKEILQVFYRQIPALEENIAVSLADVLIEYKKSEIKKDLLKKVDPLPPKPKDDPPTPNPPEKKVDPPKPVEQTFFSRNFPTTTTALSVATNEIHGIRKSVSEILLESNEPEKNIDNVDFDKQDPKKYSGGEDVFYKDFKTTILNKIYELMKIYPIKTTVPNINQIKEDYQFEDFDHLMKTSPDKFNILKETNYSIKITIIKCLLEYMAYNSKQTYSNLIKFLDNLKKELEIPISNYAEFLKRSETTSKSINNA